MKDAEKSEDMAARVGREHSVANRDLPTEDTFVKNPTQPADLVSVNG